MKAGATAADTVISSGRSLALSFRDGKLDEHERSEGDDLVCASLWQENSYRIQP